MFEIPRNFVCVVSSIFGTTLKLSFTIPGLDMKTEALKVSYTCNRILQREVSVLEGQNPNCIFVEATEWPCKHLISSLFSINSPVRVQGCSVLSTFSGSSCNFANPFF